MIRLTVIPRLRDNLFRLLVAKEIELRRKGRGTLHRSGAKKRGREKWTHASYPGWIDLKSAADGALALTVHSRAADTEWQLLRSLIGFLDRHFREKITSVTINYDRS
jgi:stalled ribosome alternative rescue factor ArfA